MVKCFHIWRSIMETLVIFITVDGVWASWGSYGACTVTCGGGTQERQRTCTNPAPQYGGANCPGSTVSSQACNTQNCPSEYDALSIFEKRSYVLMTLFNDVILFFLVNSWWSLVVLGSLWDVLCDLRGRDPVQNAHLHKPDSSIWRSFLPRHRYYVTGL